MSKASDNQFFAGIAQRHLTATGHYHGTIDEWAGPATQTAFREFAGLPVVAAPIILPTPPTMDGLPTPADFYVLPKETDSALNAFYGTPSASPTNLDWFSFPYAGIRLYSRTGEFIKDAFGDDGLPDHRCHKLLVGRVTAALMEIYATLGKQEFERQGWHVYDGFHNYRKKTGGSGLSNHSWGIAGDFNASENAYAKTTTTFSDLSINIMEKWGLLSGGRAWGLDWMHFTGAIPSISSGSYYAKNGLPKNIKAA